MSEPGIFRKRRDYERRRHIAGDDSTLGGRSVGGRGSTVRHQCGCRVTYLDEGEPMVFTCGRHLRHIRAEA
jgi:hypothetical protein